MRTELQNKYNLTFSCLSLALFSFLLQGTLSDLTQTQLNFARVRIFLCRFSKETQLRLIKQVEPPERAMNGLHVAHDVSLPLSVTLSLAARRPSKFTILKEKKTSRSSAVSF